MALVVYEGPNADKLPVGSYASTSETSSSSGSDIICGNGRSSYVGLSNQGATCYLNGLLQTLFMTPEFRRAVLAWPYHLKDGELEEQCIPLQLQRLFGLLQLSKNKAVDTVALTKSFDWDSSDVFQQQDVQELTRVLFDALEESFKGTEAENMIDLLYAGELIDYIRCIDVDYSSERTDKFLDFSVAIVPFGSDKPMHSLSECIEMFLQPEILDGDNKYYAEKFDKKVDAIKGLKFGKLPTILSVQLKRFVYDFTGPSVVQKKLNDEVKFPMILDMNKYVATRTVLSAEGNPTTVSNQEFEEFLKEQLDNLTKETKNKNSSSSNGSSSNPFNEEKYDYNASLYDINVDYSQDKYADVVDNAEFNAKADSKSAGDKFDSINYDSMTEEEVQNLVKERGEWIYELYAVLIHSGAISGGHYYAYIKDLDSKRWWNFNDSNVTSIPESTVREAWGGPIATTYSNNYYYGTSTVSYYPQTMSSSNAYMLMYRKVCCDASKVVSFPSDEVVPEYVHQIVREVEEKRLAKQLEEDEYRNRLNVKIYWNNLEHVLPCKRTDTYKDLMDRLWTHFNLQNQCCRRNNARTTSLDNRSIIDNDSLVSQNVSRLESTTNFPANMAVSTTSSVIVEDNSEASVVSGTKSVSDSVSSHTSKESDDSVDVRNLSAQTESKYDLFRLRNFNIYSKIKQETIDFEQCQSSNLAFLQFTDYKSYCLETRHPDESWELYYSDGYTILLQEFDSVTCSFKEVQSVRFKRNFTIRDLKDAISKLVTYSEDCIQILRISNVGLYDARKEILVGPDEKCVPEICSVTDGMKLFFEFKQSSDDNRSISSISTYTGDVDREVESIAFEAYLHDRNKVELKVNKPPDSEFNYVVHADSRWTISELRSAIGKTLELDPCNLRLFKGVSSGSEIKECHTTIYGNNIYTGQCISVSMGKPTPVGFFSLSFSLFSAADYKPQIVPLPSVLDINGGLNDVCLTADDFQVDWSDENAVYNFPGYDSGTTVNKSNNYNDYPYVEGKATFDEEYENIPSLINLTTGMEEDVALDDNFDAMSNEGVADSAECFSTAAGDDASAPDYSSFANVFDSTHEISSIVNEMEYSSYNYCSTNADVSDTNTHTKAAVDCNDDSVKADLSKPAESYCIASPADVYLDLPDVSIPCAPNHIVEATVVDDVPSKSLIADETIEPSDFGERKVRTSNMPKQFEPLTFEGLFIENSSSVSDVRVEIHRRLIEKGLMPKDSSARRVRLRDRTMSTPSKILEDNKTFSENGIHLYDGKDMVVELLDHDENLFSGDENGICLLVQRWYRSTWSLGQRFEVYLQVSSTIGEVTRGLCQLTDIPIHSVLAMVVPKDVEFYLSELNQKSPQRNYGRSWFDPAKEAAKQLKFTSHEMRVADGDMLLLQDTSEPLMELSPADLKSIQIVEASNSSSYSSYNSTDWRSTSSYCCYPIQNTTSSVSNTYGTSYGPYAPTSTTTVARSGIQIRTYKDRERLKEEKASSTSLDVMESNNSSIGNATVVYGVGEDDNATTIGSDGMEFIKQGGMALFDDIK